MTLGKRNLLLPNVGGFCRIEAVRWSPVDTLTPTVMGSLLIIFVANKLERGPLAIKIKNAFKVL
jgi:hypothetical protein